MKKIHFVLLFLFFSSAANQKIQAQVDTIFHFAAPWVTPDHWWRDPMAFHFSTFGNATTIRMRQPAMLYDTPFVVPPNSLFTKFITHRLDSIESKPANTILRSGIEITSDFPITVVYDIITRAPNFYNPETFSLKGSNGVGKEFVMPFQTKWRNQNLGGDLNGDGMVTQPKQQFNILATEDSTIIYITPRAAVVGGHPANVTYSILLPKKGNVYTCENLTQLTNVSGNNLAGSIVVANKPISVTVADDSVNPAGGGGCYDLMGDQLVPTDVIGKSYVINKGFLNAGSDESIFVVAVENFTTVTVENGIASTTVILNQGDTYPYSITQQRTYVNATKDVYLLHMSGYGCELGEAILPPLNCAGSDQISFSRANAQSFLLNILCKAGTEGAFTLNGSTTAIPAAAFLPVPGTAGFWLSAQVDLTSSPLVLPGTANLITNSIDLFSLGVVNGGASTGCLYHYLSLFNRKVFVDAGNDTIVCNGTTTIPIKGSINGGAITGIWSSIDGTGTFSNPTGLISDYSPSVNDFALGEITFVLQSTGNCDPVYDTLKVSFIQSPTVNATGDNSYCKNNISPIPISGAVNFATAGAWSGGIGGVFGNAGSPTTTYTPSIDDLNADSVKLYYTSVGSLYACPNVSDSVTIYFTPAPLVNSGPDITICSNESEISLSGSISGGSAQGEWGTTGSGAFSPSQITLINDYIISITDANSTEFTLYLTSTNNGNCLAVTDSTKITLIPIPTVDITIDDSICANIANMPLIGTVPIGFPTIWTTTGLGSIASPVVLNTTYSFSPLDITTGFIDFKLTTVGQCPGISDSIRVFLVNPPQVSVGSDLLFCSNELAPLSGSIVGADTNGTWLSLGSGSFFPSPNFINGAYQPSSADVGNGNVSLILLSNSAFGCPPDSDTLQLTFAAIPNANFTVNPVCEEENSLFIDVSSTATGSITNWFWDFGDATSSIAQNPLHPYNTNGTIDVSLIVTSNNGCVDTVTKPVTIYPLPNPNFNAPGFCENTEGNLVNTSTIVSGIISTYAWDFNGLETSNVINPSYAFENAGTYSIVLTATSSFGCEASSNQIVTVFDLPNASFTANPTVALINEQILVQDETPGNIVAWSWNFGNGQGDFLPSTSTQYSDGGNYEIILTVTDQNGCQADATRIIQIVLLPVLPSGFSPNGDNENDVFIIRGGPFESVDFKVYNNWGEKIFETNDGTNGWDGTFKGEPAPMGVYTWTFNVSVGGGNVYVESGDVTLIR
jgi:gliding motility-associated-like protein